MLLYLLIHYVLLKVNNTIINLYSFILHTLHKTLNLRIYLYSYSATFMYNLAFVLSLDLCTSLLLPDLKYPNLLLPVLLNTYVFLFFFHLVYLMDKNIQIMNNVVNVDLLPLYLLNSCDLLLCFTYLYTISMRFYLNLKLHHHVLVSLLLSSWFPSLFKSINHISLAFMHLYSLKLNFLDILFENYLNLVIILIFHMVVFLLLSINYQIHFFLHL